MLTTFGMMLSFQCIPFHNRAQPFTHSVSRHPTFYTVTWRPLVLIIITSKYNCSRKCGQIVLKPERLADLSKGIEEVITKKCCEGYLTVPA